MFPSLSLISLVLSVFAANPEPPRISEKPCSDVSSSSSMDAGVDMPYSGPGMVSVLNDGTLVVSIRGVAVTGGEGETSGSYYYTKDALHFKLDRNAVRLVQAGHDWFLDSNGVQVARRGLRPSDIVTTHFETQRSEANPSRFSFVDISGEMRLEYDPITGIHRVQVRGDETPDAFSTTFRGNTPAETDPADSERAANPIDSQPQTATCSATCRNGNCEITCSFPKAAQCYCDGAGYPVCQCVNPPKGVEIIDP